MMKSLYKKRLFNNFVVQYQLSEVIISKTPKEVKQLAKPEFQKNPQKYYPQKVFEKYGYTRHTCPKCSNNYWRMSPSQDTCGDPQCTGQYTFIGQKTGIGIQKNVTYQEAWKIFQYSLNNARIPCKTVNRYPIVARWRNDVDFVAAGIYCFQPYCMTGELQPPENPLIQPQFCVRFNDLDNIGLTGRHYSGFIMLGIQCFNYPNKYIFFNEECVEFNLEWLIQGLQIQKEDITLVEDVWCGGGNLGTSIEMFVKGLEVGNMVFMQYKYYPNGDLEPLETTVIDVGIGLERIPWLVNGSYNSYKDTFQQAYDYLMNKLMVQMSQNEETWKKIAPFMCILNSDESSDLEEGWRLIKEKSQIQKSVEEIKQNIQEMKDFYVILDHTRTSLVAIYDGCLPSNVGGGSNIRNILRRTFAILKKRQWWQLLGMNGFLLIFNYHLKDLENIYGQFSTYKSFEGIILMEYLKWENTDMIQKQKLLKLFSKNQQNFGLNQWILAVETYGISPDIIEEILNIAQPANLWYELENRKQKITKRIEQSDLKLPLYLPETIEDKENLQFQAKIIYSQKYSQENSKEEYFFVILDNTCFYPTSGGQLHDIGTLELIQENGIAQIFQVENVEKIGKYIIHIIKCCLPSYNLNNLIVQGKINKDRRTILRNHHTATHILFAACRKVLGPHIWQNGAKKTVEQAHLDITHYNSLKEQEIKEIEEEANKIVQENIVIKKYIIPKQEAESIYGFRLYQGGIVPGNTLRIVNIEGIDVEACCGTHCNNTNEVGGIKILKSSRISDGVVRLYYVAGEKVDKKNDEEQKILKDLQKLWGVQKIDLVKTAENIFKEYKQFKKVNENLKLEILLYQMKLFMKDNDQIWFQKSNEKDVTFYISHMSQFAKDLKELNKGVIFASEGFIFGQFGNKSIFDFEDFQEFLNKQLKLQGDFKKISNSVSYKGKKFENIFQFSYIGNIKINEIINYLNKKYKLYQI